MYLVFLLLLFFLLFLSTQALTNSFSQLFHRLTKSRKTAIFLLSLIFLPGVILHEVSHALVAFLLFVPVGKMEFVPVVDGDHVKLGSVQIEKTDPVRRFLIGIAPIVIGLFCLGGLFFYLMPSSLSLAVFYSWQLYVLLYTTFQISNTMFSSRRDMEGALELFLVIFILLVLLYVLGLRLPSGGGERLVEIASSGIFRDVSILLLMPLGINSLLLLLVRIGKRDAKI